MPKIIFCFFQEFEIRSLNVFLLVKNFAAVFYRFNDSSFQWFFILWKQISSLNFWFSIFTFKIEIKFRVMSMCVDTFLLLLILYSGVLGGCFKSSEKKCFFVYFCLFSSNYSLAAMKKQTIWPLVHLYFLWSLYWWIFVFCSIKLLIKNMLLYQSSYLSIILNILFF